LRILKKGTVYKNCAALCPQGEVQLLRDTGPRRQRGTTLAETLVDRLASEIGLGARPPGSRLFSIRKAAAEYGVSKNTVIEAYDRLVASGHIVARAGSGFVVAASDEVDLKGRRRHVAEAVDIASLLSAQLEESFDVRVGDGRPPPSWTEESEVKRHLGVFGTRMSLGSDAYGSALGFPPLRQQIAGLLATQHIRASENEILLTFGANHALDLVIRAFLEQGDVVLVDEPGYYPLFAKLKLAQVGMVGIRRNADGPDLEDFAAKIRTHFAEPAFQSRPRLFFTQSIGHNPTGGSISLAVAHGLLKIAAANNVVIVEDDPFADLAQAHRLAALDQLNQVIAIGTFSKTLSASLRSGYIAARKERIDALAELKMLTTVNSSGYVERLLYRMLAEGHYKRHLKRLAQRMEAAAGRVAATLTALGWNLYSADGGGYYLYLRLPDGIDDIAVARAGARESIFIAPGSVFCLDKANPLGAGIRINIARADDPRFYDFLNRTLGSRYA